MATYQIFVKFPNNQTQCLQIPSPTISGETLKSQISKLIQTPLSLLLLVAGSGIVSDETLIPSSSSCLLLPRLAGGKGGFGSLLRGAATKAGQKKTNNFDACRDMNGRRLRHANAEKRIEEWRKEEEDRRLEKLAEQFLKKKARERKKNLDVDVEKYLEKYREDSEKCMGEVEESVRESFRAYRGLKRRVSKGEGSSSKRLRIWMGKNKVDESCSEEDDENDSEEDNENDSDDDDVETEDKSVVLDDGNFQRLNKETNNSSLMVAGSGVSSDGESSGGASGQSNLEEANGHLLVEGSSGNVSEQSNLEDLNEKCEVVFPAVDQICTNLEYNFGSDGSSESESSFQNDAITNAINEPDKDELKPELLSQIKPHFGDELDKQVTDNSSMEEPLNFDKYNSATELQVLGMDRLKLELQARGLKCGGTLQERASRLFLLKSTPFDKLPKKLLAKPSSQGK